MRHIRPVSGPGVEEEAEAKQDRLDELRDEELEAARELLRKASEPEPGTVSGVIDRIWTSDLIDTGYALVTITNNTSGRVARPLAKCTAIGLNDQRLGVNQRSIFEGLAPGESDSVEVPIELHGATLESMSCKIRW